MPAFCGGSMRVLLLTLLVACGQPESTEPLAVTDGELLLVLVHYRPGYLDKKHATYRLLVCQEGNYDQQTLKGCQPALINNKRQEVFFYANEIDKPTGRQASPTATRKANIIIGTTFIALGIGAIAVPFKFMRKFDDLGADVLFLVGGASIVLGIIALAGGGSRLNSQERQQLSARFHEIEGFAIKLPIASVADEVRDLAAIYRVKINKLAFSS